MKKYFFKNIKLLHLVVKYELKRVFLKSLWFNTVLPYVLRFRAFLKLQMFNRRSSLSYLRLRCLMTDRARFMLFMFRLTRMAFKSRVSLGEVVGIRRSSW